MVVAVDSSNTIQVTNPENGAMDPTLEGIVGEVSRLVAEEAHLIGQELQDSLNKDQSRRLHDLTTMLDQIDDRLTRLRPAGGHRVGTD